MNNQSGVRSGTRVRIGLHTIVTHPKLCELGYELNQIENAPCVSLTNSFFRNVVATPLDTRTHARNVQFGISETDIPDADLNPCRHCLLKKRRDCPSAKRGLKGIVKALVDCPFKHASALLPPCALSFLECDARICNAY